MIKLEKMIKKLELILAGVMLPTMIIFVVLELNRLMTGTEIWVFGNNNDNDVTTGNPRSSIFNERRN